MGRLSSAAVVVVVVAAAAGGTAVLGRAVGIGAGGGSSWAIATVPGGAPPQATTVVAPESNSRFRTAVDLVDYPWEQTGYTIRFAGPVPGRLGLTQRASKTITIYARAGQSSAELARIVAHEVGHAVDIEHLTPAERDRYRQVRGIPADVAWYPCDSCRDEATVAGDFAEVFAWWLFGPGVFASDVAPPPTPAQLEALASLFAPRA